MYDWPEVQWAHDALWTAVRDAARREGVAAPDGLDRTRPSHDVWLDPQLVLSQSCGWPFATSLIGRVGLVGTPVYGVEGCEGPLYSSAVVTRRGRGAQDLPGLAGLRAAINSRDSLSGYVALRAALAEAGVDLSSIDWRETGSHRESVRAVAEGAADFAAIDAVCWALARRFEAAAAARLAPIAWTPLRLGLPLITAAGRSDAEIEAIRRAFSAALAAPETLLARSALRLRGLAVLTESDYRPIAALDPAGSRPSSITGAT